MAQFYGRLQGARGEATRCGSKASGMRGTVETWSYVVASDVWIREGVEWATVEIRTKHGRMVRVLYDGPLMAEALADEKVGA